ncbi:MAG TPA: chromate efflux transporter [Chryseosolibacter sp.]
MHDAQTNARKEKEGSLTEIAGVFLRLGCIAFGGPAVHIAMMEEEVVKKRRWITPEHFLDLVGATNLIPGPNSTEMTMHCGHERAGWKGLVVAGMCFIVPAVVITGALAWAYQKYGALPEVQPFLYGIKPAIISVIVALMISLGKKALKSTALGIIGVLALGITLAGVNEIIVLFGAGLVGVLLYLVKTPASLRALSPAVFLFVPSANEGPDWKIFLIFLKVGAILYGSGYVLFAFLDAELVAKGLLSKQQLIDAIAVGQFTPGPVFSAATFIGWQLGGAGGAVAATTGIFLPSFIFVAFLNPLIPRLRRSAVMSSFLDTVNIASVAIIFAVALEMGAATLHDWRTMVIAGLGFVITFYFRKVNTAFVVAGGAVAGYLLSFL